MPVPLTANANIISPPVVPAVCTSLGATQPLGLLRLLLVTMLACPASVQRKSAHFECTMDSN